LRLKVGLNADAVEKQATRPGEKDVPRSKKTFAKSLVKRAPLASCQC
jgi:hypothetical protein